MSETTRLRVRYVSRRRLRRDLRSMLAGAYLVRLPEWRPAEGSSLELALRAPDGSGFTLAATVLELVERVGVLVAVSVEQAALRELVKLAERPEFVHAAMEESAELVPEVGFEGAEGAGRGIRCFALYTSHRRFAEDLRAMESGAFFAPLAEEHPAIYSRLELRIHLPDGVRYDIEGEVIQCVPRFGITIGFDRKHPALKAMRMAVDRPAYREAMVKEPMESPNPNIGFTDPTKTLPASKGAARDELRSALTAIRAKYRADDFE